MSPPYEHHSMTRAGALFLIAALLSFPLDAAPKRRAVGAPAHDPSTPAGWLALNAIPLRSTERVPFTFDLEPLRTLIGDAGVVALGDGSHGTHEYYTLKLRLIDFLVRELGFEAVGIEAPYASIEPLDAYVQGSPGDPRAMLDAVHAATYPFWDVEELLEVVEWMRELNATRGARPAVHLTGIDLGDAVTAANAVVAYLRTVDPATAASAERDYACLRTSSQTASCRDASRQVWSALAARETELVPRSSYRTFHDALQHAQVIVQTRLSYTERDRALAENVLWTREHRTTAGRMVVWAHNTHIAEATSPLMRFPMGLELATDLGDDYFSLAMTSAEGTFLLWAFNDDTGLRFDGIPFSYNPPSAGSYESLFRAFRERAFVVPLTGALPAWFPAEGAFNAVGSGYNGGTFPTSTTYKLPELFDAVAFIHTTTPLHPLD